MTTEPIREKYQEQLDALFADETVPNNARKLINDILIHAEDIESERDEAIEDADTLRDQVEQRDSDQDAALEIVKYWLHDFFYACRTTKSARDILRLVEAAL